MLYTRHFYRIDEVKAALQYCISNKRSEEALFWALELFDSEDFKSIQNTLLNTWFHTIGLGNFNILKDIFELTNDSIKILNIVYAMCYVKRDCTLPVMYLYGLTNKQYKNRNIVFEIPKDLIQDNKVVDTFIRSCLLGKYLDAWLLSVSSWKHCEQYIEKILRYKYSKQYVFDIYNYLKTTKSINKYYSRCTLIGLACFAEKYYEEPVSYYKKFDHLNDTIQAWNACLTKRKRRVFVIPKECLYGRTLRGTMTYNDSNDEELHEPEYLIRNQIIYETIQEKYVDYKKFYESEDFEGFMDWYFPDDIPDEWSKQEREKSHGIGVNQKSDTPNARRYFNRWVDIKNDCKIWDKEHIVNTCLQNISGSLKSYYIEDELFEIYDAKVCELKNEQKTWNLNSLKIVLSAIE